MNRFAIICLLQVLATCACENITLTVDKHSIEENKTLTLTCSSKSIQAFVILNYKTIRTNVTVDQNNYVQFNKTDNNCTILPQLEKSIEVLSTCFCTNILTYKCVTKPLTRQNRGDRWSCQGSDQETSSSVYTSVIVPIQTATILEDIQDVIDTHEDGLVNLTCESSYAIPAANITWFLNNKTPTVYDDDQPIYSTIKTTVSENKDRTYTAKSVLTFSPHKNENGMSVYCNASNLDSKMASSRKLVLNVRYMPDTTILINNSESYNDYYMIRNSLTIQRLQCDVRGGNPHANLTWTCYEANQTHFNTRMGATSVVTWMAGTHGDSECTCTASHVLGWSAEKKVSVHVLYPPSEPTCEVGMATVSGGTVNVSLASNVTMTCTSDAYPEQSTFVWTLPNGTDVNGKELFLRSFQMENKGTHILQIMNTMTPSKGDKIEGRRNATFFLRLHRPPKITNLDTTLKVLEGVNFNLSCEAEPGNPNNTFYTWATTHHPEKNTSDQRLIMNNISRTDAGVYICFARNIMHPTGFPMEIGSDKKNVLIDVQYPATLPMFYSSTCTHNSFSNGGSIKVILGEPLRITCSAGGNPSPVYFWSESIQSSELNIENVSINHASEYSCTANNTMNDSYGKSVSSSMTSSFYLDVLYPPEITNLNKTVEVLEGDYLNLTCYAKSGNPNVTLYFWTSTKQSKRNTSGQYLIIQNTSRIDEGIFTCSVKNTMHPTACPVMDGSDVESVDVDVQYKASIKTFTALNTTVYHGDKLMFVCDVDSDPPANINISSPTGSILKYVKGSNQLHYNKTCSCLDDIGQFSCVSANKHNRIQPDRKLITVDVKCSPMYLADDNQVTPMTTRPGEKAVFYFSVFSNPPPTNFTWINSSSNIRIPDVTSSSRVIINTTDEMSSSLVITSVEPWDSGYYSVTVENEIGSTNKTFLIIINKNSEPAGETSTSRDIGYATTAAVAIGVVVPILLCVCIATYLYRKRCNGSSHHDNNMSRLIQNTSHQSEKMEMRSFDHVLSINDESPKYEEEKNIYGNIQPNNGFGKSIRIKTLRDTVQQLKLDPVPLFKEFYTLQMGLQYDTKDALKPNNVAKNRYRSVYPYDASRVVLPFLRGVPDSDFINASYIDGYCKPRKYIGSQGPLENTISDTWRMIHSEDVKIVVMVTNLIERGTRKCFKYWPDDRATYGKCNVKLDQVEEYADFVVRHLTYSMEGERFERQLIQFHYTSWPDKNVPATALSLVQFFRKVRQSELVENTPWMVHCSAGVGRTGTFIALDYLYDQGKVDEKLNVPETVNVLREQRISMVQTKEQYLYLHEAITELLDPVGQIFTPENSFRLHSTATDERKLNKEFKVITNSINVKTDFEETDYDLKRMPDGQLPENICKSIDQTVIPDDLFRPLISTGSDFINAVYIPTYRDAEKYIVTQFPLQNTSVDFVRLLWYHNIQDVVLIDDGNVKRHCYWPQTSTPLSVGPFVISLLSEDEAKHYTTRIVDISMAEQRQSKQTVIHQFTAWPGHLKLCEPKILTEFLQTISRIAGPVVVQCHDGYSRSGLFAALLSIVDRIKTDKEVAIADTVRVVKHRRQAAVTDVEQYQFCHEVIFIYLKDREANTEENQEYVNMTFPKFL